MSDKENSTTSVLNKLLENSPLSLVALGLYTIASAAAGHIPWPDLKIGVPLWQISLGGIGVAIALFGCVLIWHTRTRIDEVNPSKYQFEIVSPKPYASVPERLPKVEGIYASKPPPDQKIWILVQDPSNLTYRPRREIKLFDIPIGGRRGSWNAPDIYIGGVSGQEAIVALVVVGRAGQQLIDYFNLLPQGTRPGINKDLLMAVAKPCAEVVLKRG